MKLLLFIVFVLVACYHLISKPEETVVSFAGDAVALTGKAEKFAPLVEEVVTAKIVRRKYQATTNTVTTLAVFSKGGKNYFLTAVDTDPAVVDAIKKQNTGCNLFLCSSESCSVWKRPVPLP